MNDDNKDVVLTTINETKEEIKRFSNELHRKSKELPNISDIKKSLVKVEQVVKEIKNLCDHETKNLATILENLTYTQVEELLKKNDIMFRVINDNLPNGMSLEKEPQSNNGDFGKVRKIRFNNKTVGQVQILNESKDMLYIEVTINDFVDRFEVVKPNRMYHIISFINTKFNYE